MNVSQMFPSALAKRTIKTVFISQFFTGVYHTRSSYNSTSDIYKYLCWVFPGHSVVKNPPAKQEMGQEDSLEKKMATHSSILAWEIPWTEEPSRLQSMGSQRVEYDLAIKQHYLLYIYTFEFYIFKWLSYIWI